jgi:hypothetical protein
MTVNEKYEMAEIAKNYVGYVRKIGKCTLIFLLYLILFLVVGKVDRLMGGWSETLFDEVLHKVPKDVDVLTVKRILCLLQSTLNIWS